MNTSAIRSIRRITVDKLFGVHNYSLSVLESEKEGGKLLILYGDNGSGKTTILKLAFHLLAPEDSEGHKSTVAPIPFRRFEMELMDGTKVSAERSQEQLRQGGRCPKISKLLFTPLGDCGKERLCLGKQD